MWLLARNDDDGGAPPTLTLSAGVRVTCVGGGRIQHQPSISKIYIYGYSQAYGRCVRGGGGRGGHPGRCPAGRALISRPHVDAATLRLLAARRADHARTTEIVRRAFPHYGADGVTWSNEGY